MTETKRATQGITRLIILYIAFWLLWGVYGWAIDGWQSRLAWASAIEQGRLIEGVSNVRDGARVGDMIAQATCALLAALAVSAVVIAMRWVGKGFERDRERS